MNSYEKKVIISGVAGYIGSHLAGELLIAGYTVYGFDSMIGGSKENLKKLEKFDNFFFFKLSLNKFNKIIRAKYFFHFAAIASINNKLTFDDLYKNNVLGTEKALQISKKNGCKYFFFPSSAAVYGESKRKNKESFIKKPLSLYGFTKLCNEYQIDTFSKNNPNCKYIIFRLFNIYGGKISQNQMSVIPQWLKKIYLKQKITINNDRYSYRDYFFIDDLIKVLIFFMKKNIKFDVINIGTGKKTSLKKLLMIIKTIFFKQNIIKKNHLIKLNKINTSFSNEIKFSVSDNSKLRNFGFNKLTKLKTGIEKTIEKNFFKIDV